VAVAVAVVEELEPEPVASDDRVAALEQQVRSLESELDSLRAGRRAEIEEILRDLEAVTTKLRRRLE
jgi:hypothetical protein